MVTPEYFAVIHAVAAVWTVGNEAGGMKMDIITTAVADQGAGAGDFTGIPGGAFLDIVLELQHFQSGAIGDQ